MRSVNINNYTLPRGKMWEPTKEISEFHDDSGEYYKIVDIKTPAGFSVAKQTADAVSDLVYSANNNLQTAVSMLITTYPCEDKIPAEILRRARELRDQVWKLKEDVDRDLRGLGD